MHKMYITFQYFILLFGITAAVTDQLFGLRLTTEKLKPKGEGTYRFQYFVKDDLTGDYKAQEETKDGDSVKGSYTIGEPNGDLRTVTYTAGPGRGFEATVDVQPSASPMFSTKLSPQPFITSQKVDSLAKRFSQTVSTEKPGLSNGIKQLTKEVMKSILKKKSFDTKDEGVIDTPIKQNNDTEEVFTNVPVIKHPETEHSNAPTKLKEKELKPEISEPESESDSYPSTSAESSETFVSKLTQNLDTNTPNLKLLTISSTQKTEIHEGHLPTPKTNKISGLTKQLKVQSPSTSPDVSNISEEADQESTTFATEGRDIMEDPIEKEINEAINFMPKLPEFILPDNVTHLKFHKDPEEALLDERITQIARQLAETSLRREYEERKLGHIIPISLRPIERSTSSYLSKAFKFNTNNMPSVRPSVPVHVLTQVRIIPQYMYKDPFFPKFTQIHQRLPVYNVPKKDQLAYETVTDPEDILKLSQPEQISAVVGVDSLKYDTTPQQPASAIPVQVPTFVQFFTPLQRFFMNPQKTFSSNAKPEVLIGPQDFTTSAIPVTNDGIYYSQTSVTDDHNTEKS